MTKAEFNGLVDDMLSKAEALRENDARAGLNLLEEFKQFAIHHKDKLTNFFGVASEFEYVEDEFEAVEKAGYGYKEKLWKKAIGHLKHDIESLKLNNLYK